MLPIDLQNRIALVTGVTSGIGAGVARVLAKAGCRVVGCGLEPPGEYGARAFVQSAEQESAQALYYQIDVTRKPDLERLVSETVRHLGGIDVLVSNAGKNVFKGAFACEQKDWDDNQRLNLTSHWQLSRLAHPYLRKSNNGVIIIMSSNHAYSSIPGCFPYNVTKTALTGLVRALAIEWGPAVRVAGLAPGFIQTEGGEAWFNTFDDPAEERARTIRRHPAGRLGTPDEVGAFCAFLASDHARFMTGATYLMDGGRSAIMQDD